MSFYTSLNGISNAQTELNTIANNLANAETTGFKQSSVNFADIVAGSAYSNPKMIQGIGSMTKSIDQDFTAGPSEQTGSALNMEINGSGFFTVTSPLSGNSIYTRNGDFSADSSGYVTDSNGNRLQMLAYSGGTYATTPSDAQLPTTNAAGSSYTGVQVATDGTITASYADGTSTTLGKVAMASFISPDGLLQVGNQDWKATGLSGNPSYSAPGAGGTGNVLSGYLEQSNVNVSAQLVEMISAQQYFQANSKAISTNSQMITAIMSATQ